MGFMDKVKDFVAPIEEDDDYQEAPQAERPDAACLIPSAHGSHHRSEGMGSGL